MPITLETDELGRFKAIMGNVWRLIYPDSPDVPDDPFDVYAHVQETLKDKDRQILSLTNEANNAASFLEEVVELRKYKEEHP